MRALPILRPRNAQKRTSNPQKKLLISDDLKDPGSLRYILVLAEVRLRPGIEAVEQTLGRAKGNADSLRRLFPRHTV